MTRWRAFDLDNFMGFHESFGVMNTKIILVLVTLLSFDHLPPAGAVSPAPDGGYSGGNTAEGQAALLSLTTGGYNTAVGLLSLRSNTTSGLNTAIGAGALLANTADENTATGAGALLSNTTGNGNTANGAFALFSNTDGNRNTALGDRALSSHATGSYNNAVGGFSLSSDTAGVSNNAFGDEALFRNTTGTSNTAMGDAALASNTTGDSNTAIGFNALLATTGSSNIALGFNSGINVTTADNVICIGAVGANVSNSCFIGQIYANIQPIVGTDPDSVTIASTGRLGRGNVSSRRYKHDIKPMDNDSEVLFALKPVSFRYNKQYDATQTLAFGLIAEDVAEVNPDLVGRNPNGEPESVRYEQINAILLNEFLKEHRKVEEQQATIAELKKEIETIVAHSKEQDSQIQTVRDQVQMNRPDARAVVSNH